MKTFAGRKLQRKSQHRLLLLRGLATDLIRYEKVETTFAKGKEVSRYVESIIGIAKRVPGDDLSSYRRVERVIKDSNVRKKIFQDLKKRYANRNGGCTRVVRNGFRKGDGAPLSVVLLIK